MTYKEYVKKNYGFFMQRRILSNMKFHNIDINRHITNDKYKPSEGVYRLFDWSDSFEGFDYWYKYKDKLEKAGK